MMTKVLTDCEASFLSRTSNVKNLQLSSFSRGIQRHYLNLGGIRGHDVQETTAIALVKTTGSLHRAENALIIANGSNVCINGRGHSRLIVLL